ncbi:MAG: 35-cyclic nucleotide phosphodiesterase family protein, partial [Deltaproteobacteria bacterium]|nr:35-cyclic nucleotide phosphodiesterase family protein [Deltaproteobacteria bacterium]
MQTYDTERRKGDRRKMIRRSEDRARAEAQHRHVHKLHSLLELGQLIGLDLQLNEMLIQISRKACEVMEADRCSIFLHDPNTDELWSTVALGMAGEVIRIPSSIGLAGYCFQTGETINLKDAVLCIPIYNRAGSRSGVIQLLNKNDGDFTDEDETFLQTFGNNASVFIEIAQLQKARLNALEQSRRELERLNKAKSKALDHLSHELRTPLAVIQGNIRILKRKIQAQTPPLIREEIFESLEKNLNRLSEIQQETDQIIRTYQELETKSPLEGIEIHPSPLPENISLYPFTENLLERIKKQASHRKIQIILDGAKDLVLHVDP